jgi:hypothetical protein
MHGAALANSVVRIFRGSTSIHTYSADIAALRSIPIRSTTDMLAPHLKKPGGNFA